MKRRFVYAVTGVLVTLLLAAFAINQARAQQQSGADQTVTGAPGAPGPATITVDGRYLPNPPQTFKGQISPNAVASKPA